MENVDDQFQYRQIMTEPAWLRDRQVAEWQRSVAAYLGWWPGPSLARSRTQALAPWSRSSPTSRGVIAQARPLPRPPDLTQSVSGSLVSLPTTWGCTCCFLSHWFLTVTRHTLNTFLDIFLVSGLTVYTAGCCVVCMCWYDRYFLWYVMGESLPVLCLAWYWLTSGEAGPAAHWSRHGTLTPVSRCQ